MKILIVDDQKENRDLLEAYLTELQYQVVLTANGKEALDQLRHQHFDIIISDILMPGMDGFQLCRSVKKDEKLKRIPFVFCTATYGTKEDEELALRFGADKFLRKPVDPDELDGVIDQLARGNEKKEIEDDEKEPQNEKEVFKLYNERLIHKLEEKVVQLENEIAERRRVEVELKKYQEKQTEMVEESTTEFKQINLRLEREITERKEIEHALRESEEKLRAQYKGIPIPTYTWQKDGDDYKLINYNDTADTITRGKISDLLGKTVGEMYGDNPEVLNDFRECGPEKKFIQREMPYRYITTGDFKHLLVTYAFVPPDLILVHTQDITKRKQAEEILKKSHLQLETEVAERTRQLTEETEKAQQYLDIAGVMIVVINPDRTVALINKKGCEILGYTYEEIIGKNWFDNFLPENIRGPVNDVFTKLMAGDLEPVEYYENPVLTKDGKVKLIAWHNALIRDENGKILRTLASGSDITERKKAEEMIIQAEKMASMGSLAAGMAHEINNPLAGILQSIHVIQGRISTGTPANRKHAEACGTTIEAVKAYLDRRKVSKFLEGSKEAGERAAAIVENMLSFSRKSESTVTPNDIGQLLDKTVALAENEYDLKKKYDFRQITIKREYTPDLPKVPCEATKIQQVVLNLLKNAAQAVYQSEHGREHEEPRITLRTFQKNDFACIEVEDNGPGIPDETRRRIFEPFFTTKTVGTGTGLGLAVSYFIVTENHGGSMDVQATPGRGTTFVIRLPMEKER